MPKSIPKLTRKQGQRFFEAFLKDRAEPVYAELMSWSFTRDMLAEILGCETYEVSSVLSKRGWFEQFWGDVELSRKNEEKRKARYQQRWAAESATECITPVTGEFQCGHAGGLHEPWGPCTVRGCPCSVFTPQSKAKP